MNGSDIESIVQEAINSSKEVVSEVWDIRHGEGETMMRGAKGKIFGNHGMLHEKDVNCDALGCTHADYGRSHRTQEWMERQINKNYIEQENGFVIDESFNSVFCHD